MSVFFEWSLIMYQVPGSWISTFRVNPTSLITKSPIKALSACIFDLFFLFQQVSPVETGKFDRCI